MEKWYRRALGSETGYYHSKGQWETNHCSGENADRNWHNIESVGEVGLILDAEVSRKISGYGQYCYQGPHNPKWTIQIRLFLVLLYELLVEWHQRRQEPHFHVGGAKIKKWRQCCWVQAWAKSLEVSLLLIRFTAEFRHLWLRVYVVDQTVLIIFVH